MMVSIRKFFPILFVLLLIFSSSVLADNEEVKYSGHVEDYGWMDYVSNGATAGTTGESKRVEALKIQLSNVPEGSHIEYSAHVEDYGWMNYVQDNQVGGTEGQKKRVEAFKIRLSGPIGQTHDVYYRTHISDFGWMGWAKNDEVAGSTGYAKRMEAIEIRIQPKGSPAPGITGAHSIEKDRLDRGDTCLGDGNVFYTSFVRGYGWQEKVPNGVSGTQGLALPLEAVRVGTDNLEGSVVTSTHVSNIGWTDPVGNSMDSGLPNGGQQVEAVKFNLSGNIGNIYDIYYRVHVSNIGWLGWAKDGAPAGTSNGCLPIEAYEIKIIPVVMAGPNDGKAAFKDLTRVHAEPGKRTVQNFLLNALLPVGQTNYVFGGGWNAEDTGAGPAATYIGVYPQWKAFFDQQNAGYNYLTTRFQIMNGLDCSGYVGWAVYNTLNTQNGGAGEVALADEQARWYASKGYGTYTNHVTTYLPGDIVSMEEDGHVWICIGGCPDGSVVIAHASPPGVMITGLSAGPGQDCQARQLAHSYMSRYYPEYYARYANQIDRYMPTYLAHNGQFRWGDNFVGDPDGIRHKSAAEVLKILFNEFY